MNIQLRFFTRSGNTQKLADAIATAINVQALSIDAPLQEKADILFLGCSYYGFDVDPAIKSFVSENKRNIGRIVCFGTSAMMKSIYKPMKKIADEAGVVLASEEFHCHGSFGPFHKGRPNEKDISKVSDFAVKVVENSEQL
ncbi:MAG: flavodoxin [Ruminococcus sp.]|nr:flavodoxin [Ruminococcus sp.]